MWGQRKQNEPEHDYVSHWGGPGLVRMVCNDCSHVRIKLGELSTGPGGESSPAVDSPGWMVVESA